MSAPRRADLSAKLRGRDGGAGTVAKFKTRPPVRAAGIVVDQGSGEESRESRNLDDVLRVILWDLIEENGWTEKESAKWLGLARSTLQDFLDTNAKGTQVTTLTAVCGALKMSPDVLFQNYEGFAPEGRATIRYAEDVIFDQFRQMLTTDQARQVLDFVADCKKHGDVDERLRALQALTRHHSKGQKRRKKGARSVAK